MANKQGDWIWYELMTPDADASAAFYADVVRWTVGDQPEYREIAASEGIIGGMLPLDPDMIAGGARPAWLGYIAVDDVDAKAASITAAGGRTIMPPRDIPGIGRFAMLADLQGATFYIMRPIPPASDPNASSNAFAGDRPMDGHCAWNELATSDPQAAKAFYFGQFGWVKDGEMDMGPMGAYEMIRHGPTIGAIMKRPPHVQVSAWNFYFRVPDIDAAASRTKALGGQVLHGPIEIPGGDYSMNAVDPQGAMFALVGKKG